LVSRSTGSPLVVSPVVVSPVTVSPVVVPPVVVSPVTVSPVVVSAVAEAALSDVVSAEPPGGVVSDDAMAAPADVKDATAMTRATPARRLADLVMVVMLTGCSCLD